MRGTMMSADRIGCFLLTSLMLLCFAAPARVMGSATSQPTDSDQFRVDAAMARLRAKRAAGPSLDEKVSDLERKIATQKKRIDDLEARLAAAVEQIEQLAATKAMPIPRDTPRPHDRTENGAVIHSAKDANAAALERARSNLASHLKSLQEAKERVSQIEQEIKGGGKPNSSLDVARQSVSTFERWVTQDQLEIARLGGR